MATYCYSGLFIVFFGENDHGFYHITPPHSPFSAPMKQWGYIVGWISFTYIVADFYSIVTCLLFIRYCYFPWNWKSSILNSIDWLINGSIWFALILCFLLLEYQSIWDTTHTHTVRQNKHDSIGFINYFKKKYLKMNMLFWGSTFSLVLQPTHLPRNLTYSLYCHLIQILWLPVMPKIISALNTINTKTSLKNTYSLG